jgi:hypothetical protein
MFMLMLQITFTTICLGRCFITIVSCLQRRDAESTNISIASFIVGF